MNRREPLVPMRAGTVAELTVAEETQRGFQLTNGEQSVLLPFPEALGKPIKAGDRVDAFLYHDSEDRLVATLRTPLAKYGELARLKVEDVHPKLGFFLELGLARHVLLPMKELPSDSALQPMVGDEVYVVIDRDKEGRLLARTPKEAALQDTVFRAPSDWFNRWVDGWVYRSLTSGSLVIIEGGVLGFGAIGFIPAHERSRKLRVGEKVNARVTFVREDGHVNLSMRKRKELGMSEDAERLLSFMKERPNGAMPYSDETPADIITTRFGMSKSAFKRAVGKLMKDGLVEQKGSWTQLTETAKAAPAEGQPADG